jgi:hypothetical protein
MKKHIVIFMLVAVLLVPVRVNKAEANPILAGAIVAEYLPAIAASVLTGVALWWNYKNDSGDAFLQMTDCIKDGVSVGVDWIKEKIAQMHGVNTEGSAYPDDVVSVMTLGPVYPDSTSSRIGVRVSGVPMSQNVYDPVIGNYRKAQDGEVLQVSSYLGTQNYSADKVSSVVFDSINNYILVAKYSYPSSSRYKYVLSSTGEFAQSNFDPDDYPELYEGQTGIDNAVAALSDGGDPVVQYSISGTPGPSDNVIEIPITAMLTNSTALTAAGTIVSVPDDFDTSSLPVVDPSSIGNKTVNTAAGAVPINKALDNLLSDSGITEGSVINKVGTDSIEWTDANGVRHVTKVESKVASAVKAAVPGAINIVAGSAAGSVEVAVDDFSVPDMDAIPIFDTVIELPEKMEMSEFVNSMKELLPWNEILEGTEVQASGSSVYTFSGSLGESNYSHSFDFAEWANLLSFLGNLLYSAVCLRGMVLVIIGR